MIIAGTFFLFIVCRGVSSFKLPHNGRGFTQGGEGLFPLLAWPLLTRLAKAKLLKLI
jgi:hypothetical protein